MNKSSISLAVSLSVLVCAPAVTSASAQTAESPLQFERGFPTAVTAEKAHAAADLRRAIEAYKFFFPTMGTEAVMQQMLSNGAKVNENRPRDGHLATAFNSAAANSDTPYALATIDLEVYQGRWWSSCHQVRLSPS